MAEPQETVFSIGPGMKPPRRLSGKMARFEKLRESGGSLLCTCVLSGVVPSRGEVVKLRWIRPDNVVPEALEEILDVVGTWRFEAAEKDGQKVAVHYSLTVSHCPCSAPRPVV